MNYGVPHFFGHRAVRAGLGKNNSFRNHSALFLPGDRRPIPYYYVDDEGAPLTEQRSAFARPLRSVVRRLDMLGYTLPGCRRMYEELHAEAIAQEQGYREYLLGEYPTLSEHYEEGFG